MIEAGFSKSIPYDKKESYADLVTEVDKAVENYICQEILSSFPTHKIIAEEGYSGNAELTCSPTWIIDPIDGTSNFPELAVVYNPILKWLFHGIRNQGAFLNDKQIHTSKLQDLSQALVLTDWGGDRNPSVLDIKSNNIRQIISKARGSHATGIFYRHIRPGKPVDLMARNVICAGTPELANALIPLIQPVGYARD
uniref:Inositol monophosphatase 2 n=1 Tax=Schistosoma haematobium TaxID=6185 RepID=A0A095CE67_SCHHA